MSYSRRNFSRPPDTVLYSRREWGITVRASTGFPAVSPAVAGPFSSEKAMFWSTQGLYGRIRSAHHFVGSDFDESWA